MSGEDRLALRRINGIGSTPASAMRPAKTEIDRRRSAGERVGRDLANLVEGHERGGVHWTRRPRRVEPSAEPSCCRDVSVMGILT